MKKIFIIICCLYPFSSIAAADESSLLLCKYGKVLLGRVVPYSEPEYRLPKYWVLKDKALHKNDYDGDFHPVYMLETGEAFYQNSFTDDVVTKTLAISQVHQPDEINNKWIYYKLSLDRVTGFLKVAVRQVPANETDRRYVDHYPVTDSFSGVCEKIEAKI